jgi:hypothetical protein
MSKERVLFDTLCSDSLSEEEKSVLAVHATLVSNGFLPSALSSNSERMVNLLPSSPWPAGHGADGVYSLRYIGGLEVRCVVVSADRIMIHASRGPDLLSGEIRIGDIENIFQAVKQQIVKPLISKDFSVEEQRQSLERPPVGSMHAPPQPRGYKPPQAPAFGTPIGPGELVGPNHPIFTGEEGGSQRPGGVRDPRYDPLGPGFIGEPDTDHFPPPPFGQPPGGRRPPGRAPLRGPHANLGPGGMFM